MSVLSIAEGHVFHSRAEGVSNTFRYPIFYLHFDCENEVDLVQLLKQRAFGLFSFKGSDYLEGSQAPLSESVRSFLKAYCAYEPSQVLLQTMPRMFGYAFNPVNFWLCRRAGKLEAVLSEVHNTFGEKHYYWLCPGGEILDNVWLKAEKVFHVSPFFPVDGSYQFRFAFSENEFKVDINYFGTDQKLRLKTWTSGKLQPMESLNFWSLLFRYGWLTPFVVIRIHWQAVRLWMKGAKFYRKPELPKKEVTT